MNEHPLEDVWLSAVKVAEMLTVSKMTVYRMCERDDLRYFKVGKAYRISEASVARFIAQGGSDAHELPLPRLRAIS